MEEEFMDNELDALLEVTKIQKELVNKAIEEGIRVCLKCGELTKESKCKKCGIETIPFKKLFGFPK